MVAGPSVPRTGMQLRQWVRSGATAVLPPLVPMAVAFLAPAAGAAQDVELLARQYGTQPPSSYYEALNRDAGAFTFERSAFQSGDSRGSRGSPGGGLSPLFNGRQKAPGVTGTFYFPVLPILFSDSPSTPPYSADQLQREFFEGPNSRGATITEYYDEISGGRVTLLGATRPWSRSTLEAAVVAGGVSGLAGGRVGPFILGGLARADSSGVDFGLYDNDGPDGVPNSGDDDGFVDVLAVVHPTRGAECDNDENSERIWSHRWTLRSAAGGAFETSTSSNSATNANPHIQVDNYTIQPAISCDGVSLNEIGVFAHELGHGFGLPDLYAVGSADHAAVGQWGLMASGAWGCEGRTPERPCHMTAWSKVALGWVDVTELDVDSDHGTLTLGPVESTGRVIRVATHAEPHTYVLLENRQRIGSDRGLPAPGLMVWQIDQEQVEARIRLNRINSDPDRMGVWLRQADGRGDLARAFEGAGDGGDPFPGTSGNRAFHYGSDPAARTSAGQGLGVTILDVESVGTDMRFRLSTRQSDVTLRVAGTGAPDVISIDGNAVGSGHTLRSAPFQPHEIKAIGGEALGPGVRRGFLGWEDGSPADRHFTTGMTDSVLTASYRDREVEVVADFSGPVPGIVPGVLRTSPGHEDGWVPEGAAAVVEAVPVTGFAFVGWGGAHAGQPNPMLRLIDTPIHVTADFSVLFSASGNPAHLV
ncbi:MAG: M6 family metalloprotease domain-containing protein, partial [Longimicrobiales bacterium]